MSNRFTDQPNSAQRPRLTEAEWLRIENEVDTSQEMEFYSYVKRISDSINRIFNLSAGVIFLALLAQFIISEYWPGLFPRYFGEVLTGIVMILFVVNSIAREIMRRARERLWNLRDELLYTAWKNTPE